MDKRALSRIPRPTINAEHMQFAKLVPNMHKAVQNTYARLEKRFTWENTASQLIEIAEKM